MNSSDGMLIVNVSAIQAVAIAAVTYYFGRTTGSSAGS